MVKMMPLLAQLIWLWLLLILECDQGSGQRSRSIDNIPPSSFITFDGESNPDSSPSDADSSPSNADSSGSSIPLSEEELDRIQKEKTRNTVRLAATDQLNSEIITNRTRAYLNCESGEMIVKINFSAPFRGVAYSDYDRSSPCKFYGDGSKYYEMRLPLKGCGTKQEAPRLFINNIIVRFHRSLELEEDEIKTIICRYPPPQAPPPPSVVAPILESTVPVPVIVPAKLSEIELLLIICALLFLTLLLLGIGIAYYCLKRRNIKIIRKKKISPAPSEITKVSTIFDQIRIPRATMSVESSETIPSDYPSSESDERRTIVSETSTLRNDHFRFENTAYVPDPYPVDNEKEDSVTSFPIPVAHKPRIQTASFLETLVENDHLTEEEMIEAHHKRTTACLYKRLSTSKYSPSIPDNDNWSQTETESKLSLAVYVKNRDPPNISYTTIEDTFLTTEYDRDINVNDTHHRQEVSNMYKKMAPRKIPAPSIPDNDDWSQTEVESRLDVAPYHPNKRRPKVTSKTITDSYLDYEQDTESAEITTAKTIQSTHAPKLQLLKTDETFVTNINETEITEKIITEQSGFNQLPSRGPLTNYQSTGGEFTNLTTNTAEYTNQQDSYLRESSSSSHHVGRNNNNNRTTATAPPSTTAGTISNRVGAFDMEMIRDWTYQDTNEGIDSMTSVGPIDGSTGYPIMRSSHYASGHHSHSGHRWQQVTRSPSGHTLDQPSFDDYDDDCPECRAFFRRGPIDSVDTISPDRVLMATSSHVVTRNGHGSGGLMTATYQTSSNVVQGTRIEAREERRSEERRSEERRSEERRRQEISDQDLLMSEEKHWQRQLLQ